MMYHELYNLTNGQATYEQFLNIESVYNAKENMTKQQAAKLWKRRYGTKEEKPLAKELKEIKQSIRDFKDNREYLDYELEIIRQNYREKIAEYDPEDWMNRRTIESLTGYMNRELFNKCEEFGLDAAIYIIYKDGSTCIASGTEIVTGEVTPKMQHILYANYSDGWIEYDTFTGILVDDNTCLFGDLSTDEGIEAREAYYNMVENKFRNRMEENQ